MRQAVIFSEPKADVSLILRNPKAMDSARNQVMFALNDYLAGLALDQLSNQRGVGWWHKFSTTLTTALWLMLWLHPASAAAVPVHCSRVL